MPPPPPSPVFLPQKTPDRPGDPANHCSSLKNSNQFWRHCHHKVASLVDLHFFVSSACHVWAIFLAGEGARANRGEVHDGGAMLPLVFVTKYWCLCSRARIGVFFGHVFWWWPWQRSCGRPQERQMGPRQLHRHRCLVTICCLSGGSGYCRSECSGTRRDSQSVGGQ